MGRFENDFIVVTNLTTYKKTRVKRSSIASYETNDHEETIISTLDTEDILCRESADEIDILLGKKINDE